MTSYFAFAPSSQSHPDSQGNQPNFVGSPDQVDSVEAPSNPQSLHHDHNEDSISRRSRLSYGRSISFVSSSKSDANPAAHATASSLYVTSHERHRPEREWSVFGQLMDRDDQYRLAPGTPSTIRPRRAMPPSVVDVFETHSTRTPSADTSALGSVAQIPGTTSPLVDPFPATPQPEGFSARDEYSDNSVDSPEESGSEESPATAQRSLWMRLRTFTLPRLYCNILKCSLAYFIGSLFTFSPYLSTFIADLTNYGSGERIPSPSGHMVATITVYFNPAKTLGGMAEADGFCFMGLFFSAFVSLMSMSMYWFFEVQPGWEWLADTSVLFWIGLGMSAVAWMKVWMAKPSFNTACSMTAIIIFTVVVREGGLETLLQVSFIVVVGSLISNAVCLLLWPQRATDNLKTNMIETLNSFSTILTTLTDVFLLEEPLHRLSYDKLQQAIDRHQASFTSLKKNLAEAQSERWFGGPGTASGNSDNSRRLTSGQAYEDAIESLNRLGQHLNGLRSGTSLQYDLIKAHRDGKLVLHTRSTKRKSSNAYSYSAKSMDGKGKHVGTNGSIGSQVDEEGAMLQAAADTFGELVDDLGPPLKALSSNCASSLRRLREAFAQPRGSDQNDTLRPEDFIKLAENIERALFTFESTSNHAVLRLYRTRNPSGLQSRSSVNSESGLEDSMILDSDNENLFLAYFYIFTLQEFARELISLVDAMERICTLERAKASRSRWRQVGNAIQFLARNASARSAREKNPRATLSRRFSALFIPKPHKATSFPKVRPHAPNTVQTPAWSQLSFLGRIQYSIWALGARLKEQDMKYAFKAGMATAILAAPAFFESTRPTFVEYRGEWALISFFVVISPTIGATNFLGVHRVLGTLLGAATAFVVWTAFPENPYALSIFGTLYSIPCFYYIVAKPQYATSARFVLLTYNLTCLYCYNSRQKDVPVMEIAFHRAVAVTVGVVWAAIVSRYWWPTEARRELSRALGDFCLNMGWLYTRLVAFNSFADTEHHLHGDNRHAATEATSLLPPHEAHITQSIQDFMAMELHLQIKLIELQGLLSQTQHEPRLKGPFPVALYRRILTSLQAILDKLHSMRCVTSREEWHTEVVRDYIIPVNKERREMVGNIILYFSVLAAAFRLKFPLAPYLPPAEKSRQRLVDAIRRLDVVRNRDAKGSRQLLFFAYALTMKNVIQELDYLGRTLQEAFGVIGQSTAEFEALFPDVIRSQNTV